MLTKLWRKLRQQDRVEELEASLKELDDELFTVVTREAKQSIRIKGLERLAYSQIVMTVKDPNGNVMQRDREPSTPWKELYERVTPKLARIRAILDEEEA